MEAHQLIVAALAILAGTTVLGTLGFGIGIVASPFLLLVVDPQTAVVVLNTVSVATLVLLVGQARSDLPLRDVAPMAAAGVIGVPAGVFVLSALPASALRIGIAGLILFLAVVVSTNAHIPYLGSRRAGPVVGLLVGALISGLAIGGPLVVLHLMERGWARRAVRVSTSFYYLLLAASAVVGYAIAGLFTAERITLILVVAVPAFLGLALAVPLVSRMREQIFRRAVIAVIASTSVLVLGREILGG